MRLALIQCNPTIGDLRANAAMILARAHEAAEQEADLIVTPELAITGYPPRDLITQEGFVDDARQAILKIAAEMPKRVTLVVGTPWRAHPDAGPSDYDPDERPTNSLVVLRKRKIIARYQKRLLPSYDVFDEDRYFRAGNDPVVIEVDGIRVGLSICEDLWRADDVDADGNGPFRTNRYRDRDDPVTDLVELGAQLILNPSASPFVLGKGMIQRKIITRHIKRHNIAIAAVNQVGANDDLIFDGHSAVFIPSEDGPQLIAAADGFTEQTLIVKLKKPEKNWSKRDELPDPIRESDPMSLLWRALVLGVRDYAHKSGFKSALLGISGGIDSAVTAAIAAAALQPENVLGVLMPSRYSSDHSVTDAQTLAYALKINSITIPISQAHEAMEHTIAPAFAQLGWSEPSGITEENIQSRLRGVITMALSNKGAGLLLTTGNKSELAVGYCTLYGDMNGGLAVLSDVTKVQVYKLARWLNDNHAEAGFEKPPIPVNSIEKPPSAELRPNQRDQDSLPEYEVLDEIVERYVERRQHPRRIIDETGIDWETVARIVRLIDHNEYKRKQMPIGLKVSSVAFGRGRRRPLAQRYRPEQSQDD